MPFVDDIDRALALRLVDASIQAYNAFDGATPGVCRRDRVTAPDGFEVVEGWTGVDAVFNVDRTVECYGIVLRSVAAPHDYIFAFRGTDSFEDALDDLGARRVRFRPAAPTAPVPVEVEVEAGFSAVYHDADGATPSMQAQLFALLRKYQDSDQPIARLYVTGHSLGAALSQLFSLDVAVSMPELVARNYNYACPRVGNAAFVECYDRQAGQRDRATRTVRVQNVYDRVPCVPLEDMGYRHTPDAYLVAFFKDSWIDLDFLADNHSAVHYQTVLRCAFSRPEGVCVDKALPVPGRQTCLTSERPDPAVVCRLW